MGSGPPTRLRAPLQAQRRTSVLPAMPRRPARIFRQHVLGAPATCRGRRRTKAEASGEDRRERKLIEGVEHGTPVGMGGRERTLFSIGQTAKDRRFPAEYHFVTSNGQVCRGARSIPRGQPRPWPPTDDPALNLKRSTSHVQGRPFLRAAA